jgi:hypothetical protein
MSDSTPAPNSYPLLNRELLMKALANPARWTAMKLMFTGEGIGPGEFGQIIGCSGSAAKKHLESLLAAGICMRGRSRTYRFVPRFQPPPGSKVIDFGHCLIRFDLDAPAS